MRIDTLRVKACRGIVDGPDLRFGTGGLILCGDNGTGKSSYIDAIEKVLTGECGSLDIGARLVSWKKHGHHIISKEQTEINLTIARPDNKKIEITLDPNQQILDSELQKFLDAAKQKSFILRRRTLLNFVDAEPKGRYQALEDFLNLQEYGSFEKQLHDVKDQIESDLNTAKQQLSTLETSLKFRLSITSGLNSQVVLEVTNLKLSSMGLSQVTTVEDIATSIEKIQSMISKFGNTADFQCLSALRYSIDLIPKPDYILALARGYSTALDAVFTEESKLKGHFYDKVLENGISWIQEDELDTCPLCNGPIDRFAVVSYVHARLSENKHLQELKEKKENCKHALISSITDLNSKFSELCNTWSNQFNTAIYNDSDKIKNTLSTIKRNVEDAKNPEDVAKLVNELELLDLARILGELKTRIDHQAQSSPDINKYKQLSELQQWINYANTNWLSYQGMCRNISKLEISLSWINECTDIAEKARKNAVQKLVNSVADKAEYYLKEIHPDDGIGKPKLQIADSGTGSISLASEYYGKNGDPRGLLSEGHIDSLGLCIFLAIRRLHFQQRPELSILILDDVLHSVDGEHRNKTANLIFKEFSDHQIIITTHDPLWFENLKASARKNLPSGKFVIRRISDWAIDTGPIFGDHKSDYEWLVSESAKQATPADSVIKAGRLLEEILHNLCHNFSIPVPFRITGDYTINPLWESFLPQAKKMNLYSEIGNHLDNLDSLRMQRNWVGAHWNAWAAQLTSAECSEFITCVLALYNAVYCSTCQQFIKRITELNGVWSCKRECIRYESIGKK